MGVPNFQVDQLAELRSFEEGYRGSWFRCKIKGVRLKQNMILPEYYDFDSDELRWEKIYEVPPYSRKSKHIKGQLMIRPQYPATYNKSEMPPLKSISQVCVVTDGAWKVGDLVDWFEQGCFWSARVVKVLSDDKVQIELPMPPSGEGKEGEEGKHEAFRKDLRPFLNWSETKGWTLPTVDGRTSGDAQLIFPTKQEGDRDEENVKTDLEVEHAEAAAAAPSSTTLSISDRDEEKRDSKVERAAASSSTTRISTEGEEESEQNEENVKVNCEESSECTSSLRVGKRKAVVDEVVRRELNIMHEDTLEAAIIDLEELVNKLKWMQRLLLRTSSSSSCLN